MVYSGVFANRPLVVHIYEHCVREQDVHKCIRSFTNDFFRWPDYKVHLECSRTILQKTIQVALTLRDKPDHVVTTFHYAYPRFHSPFTCSDLSHWLLKRMRRVRPELLDSGNWQLLHDNAPTHNSIIVQQFLAKRQFVCIDYPHNLQICPLDFFLFPKTGDEGQAV